MDKFTEKTLGCERKYTGKIISVDLLDIELPDGRRAKLEVIRHGNAVAILARRPDGKFVFVKQYRKAAEEGIRNGMIFDSKTLSAWACYRLMK